MEKLFNNPIMRSKASPSEVKIPEMALGYLLGPLCAMLANSIFGAYLNRYYVDVLGWTKFGAFATLLPIVSVALVIAGNLYVGQLIDKTRTPAGKARPYLVLAAPFSVLAVILMLSTPTGAADAIQMVWIAVTYNLFYAVAYPCYYTAHSSLVPLSTRDADKRNLLATLSNASMVASAGLGASILVPVLLQPFMFVTGADGSIDISASYANWRVLGIALAILSAVGIMLEYWFTRERVTEETAAADTSSQADVIPMKDHIKACLHEKYWVLVILLVFFYQLGQLIKNGSMSFYARWMFDSVLTSADPETASSQLMSLLGLIGGLPSAIGMLFVYPLTTKFGKVRCMLVGFVITVIGGVITLLNVHSFPVVCAGVVLKSAGVIPAQYVLLALVSDVLDHMEAKNGFRSDGFTMSIYSAFMAGMAGLALGIINGFLTVTGYDASGVAAVIDGVNVLAQPAAAQTAMVAVYLLADAVACAIGAIFLLRVDVEKYSAEDQRVIAERQGATDAAAADGAAAIAEVADA